MKVNFSKNGNLIYEGYVSFDEGMWCLQMADCVFAAEMPTKQGLIEEGCVLLEELLIRNLEKGYIRIPKTHLKPEEGSEIYKFELNKSLSNQILDFIKNGGKVKNA